jgi:hypothetical protein
MGPNRVGVSLPSPEDGNRSSFLNVMFSGYLEFRTMHKVQKPGNSECYTASSEPFNITITIYHYHNNNTKNNNVSVDFSDVDEVATSGP